jgi:hypothetical protein
MGRRLSALSAAPLSSIDSPRSAQGFGRARLRPRARRQAGFSRGEGNGRLESLGNTDCSAVAAGVAVVRARSLLGSP